MHRFRALLGVLLASLELASCVRYTSPTKCSRDAGIATGIISRQRVASHQACQALCDHTANCTGFNYEQPKRNKCVLNSGVAGQDARNMMRRRNYHYVEKVANGNKSTACDDFQGCRPILEFDSHETVVSRRDTYGWWGRDCWPGATDDYWYEMTNYNNRNNLQVYSTEWAFTGDVYQSITLPFGCDGANHIVYKRVFYCGGYNAPQIYTYDLDTGRQAETIDFTSVEGKAAGYRDTCRYHWGGYSDLDMASDEFGLWVIWGRRNEECAFAISKIDHETKSIVKTWFVPRGLQFDKNDYGNAFMVCGNMYVMNHHHHRNTYVRWIYYTGNSTWVEISGSDPNRIILENWNVYNNYLNYSPRDQKLYSWENQQHNRYLARFRD